MSSRAERVKQALLESQEAPSVKFLDPSTKPERPEPIIENMFERGALTGITAPRSNLKSIIMLAGAAALDGGEDDYLGLKIGKQDEPYRTLVIDGENPGYLAHARYHAMGCSERVMYAAQQGIRVGDGKWDGWIRAHCEEHMPDLVLVDGLLAATAIKQVNDAGEITEMMGALKAIANAHNCAVAVYHHERKRQVGAPYDRTDAALGSVMFANLADIHLSTALVMDGSGEDAKSAKTKSEPDASGIVELRTPAVLRWLRVRDDVEPDPIQVVAVGFKRGRELLSLRVESEGRALSKSERRRVAVEGDVDRMLTPFAIGEEVTARQLSAALLGTADTSDKHFKEVRTAATDCGRLEDAGKRGSGSYRVVVAAEEPPL